MCKPRTRETLRRQAPFEGETLRLDRRAAASERSCGLGWTAQRHMVWWLIWPLIALVKWLAPLALVALETASRTMVSVPLLASVVLIAAGLLLLRRR